MEIPWFDGSTMWQNKPQLLLTSNHQKRQHITLQITWHLRAIAATESCWNCPRSYPGTWLHAPAPFLCVQCQWWIPNRRSSARGNLQMFGLLAVEITIMLKGWAPWCLNKALSQDVDKRKEAAQAGPALWSTKKIEWTVEFYKGKKPVLITDAQGPELKHLPHIHEKNQIAFSRRGYWFSGMDISQACPLCQEPLGWIHPGASV